VSFATKGEVLVDIFGTHVMGVPIPVIRKSDTPLKTELGRGYSITGVGARIDSTASKFEEIIDIMIQSADIETRLRRLGEELQKTNRRVNALENVVIPELAVQVKFIFSALDERAREDHFRLKKVKKKIMESPPAISASPVTRFRPPAGSYTISHIRLLRTITSIRGFEPWINS
jgi:V/A-type H+-transporting ATPase subunit D